jgi:hypothetical protein
VVDLAVCQQLAVVVAAVDTRDEAVDASPDVNGIVHGPPGMMTPDVRRGTPAFACPRGAEKARTRQLALPNMETSSE